VRGAEGTVTVVWAGKRLDVQEESSLRRVVALLGRIEVEGATQEERSIAAEGRMNLERFLPENADGWTPNELEAGAYLGPWMRLEAQF
jgi:hypothetical protein